MIASMRLPYLLFGSLLLTGANAIVIHSPLIGALALVLWLWSVSWPFGALFAPQAPSLGQRLLGTTLSLAVLALLGSLLYYTLPVSTLGLLAVLLIVSSLSLILRKYVKHVEITTRPKTSWQDWGLFGLGCVSLAAWWSAVMPVSITAAVRSPWLALDVHALIALAVCACAAVLLALRGQRVFTVTLIAAMSFSIVALCAAIYPLGYGFDPFLHRATLAHIIEYGTITPKPLYYIGQYALELMAVKVFALPLFATDILLAPVMLALAVLALASVSRRTPAFWLVFILLPLSAFVPTTPQAIAYVFALLAIFSTFDATSWRHAGWIFGAATLITHPLAGIPVIIFLMIDVLLRHRGRRANLLAGATALLGSFALPAVFLLQAALGQLDIAWSSSPFDLSRLPLTGFFENSFSTWMDALYLVGANLLLLLLVLSIFSIRSLKTSPTARALFLIILALAINFIVLNQAFDFQFLITYERSDFALRLLVLMALFALPLAGNTLERLIQHLSSRPLILRILPCLLGALALSANAYVAYPRHDNYARSAGFNVSVADMNVVHAINQDADGTPYVVLANQAVSAAAVETFGFAHYFPGDIFYYPIPTGGPLYGIFLEMVDGEPSTEHAQEAMALTGSERVYLVVNDYWWQSDKIIASAKEQADDWFALNDGALTVFVFTKAP